MSSTPAWVIEIEALARGLPVVLVEGEEDETWLGHFLDAHAWGWRSRLYLALAGGKRRVIQAVTSHRPAWLGIVDRDDWREADIRVAAAESNHLHILPRFCVESYLCDPSELWIALPQQQRDKVGGDIVSLAKPITDALPAWVAHGAMWRVLREIHEVTRFPSELEEHPVTGETQIRQILTSWHEKLAPDVVLEQYHSELARGRALSETEQLHHYIHGKRFFSQVVVQVLDQAFSGKGADDWQQKLRDAPLLPPPDLVALLDRVLAQLP
jgi:hypothetical protein